jgi:hypothetical protein
MKKPSKFNLPSFSVWAKKKFGVVSATSFDPLAIFRSRLRAWWDTLSFDQRKLLANAAEGWYNEGKYTAYPVDAPYATRYLMVAFAPLGTAQPTGIPYTLPPQALCMLYPTNRLPIPLGICTDEPDNSGQEEAPFIANIQLLGGGQARTSMGITDSVVNFNTLLVGSPTVAGNLAALPSTPGSYWSPGLSLSTSEGLGAQIQFDPRCQVVNVDVIT